MSVQDDALRVPVETRAAWRAWLAGHAATSQRAWLVSWREHTGRPAVGDDDAVSEALAFGWVDSVQREVDDDRTMLCSCARERGSARSRPNELRFEALELAGLMTDAGRRVVEAAKTDGSWSVLDDVEDLVVPPDPAEASDRHPGAREQWEAFPRSPRRGILEWVVQAERPATRAARVEQTGLLAARGERADQWRPVEGAAASRYPLTAPLLRLATICRLKKTYTMSGGIVMSRMSGLPVFAVGRAVGWPDPSSMSRRFGRTHGMSPTRYRSSFVPVHDDRDDGR